jgi:hypothetical protein
MSIDLGLQPLRRDDDGHVSVEVTREDDETFTMASISVDEEQGMEKGDTTATPANAASSASSADPSPIHTPSRHHHHHSQSPLVNGGLSQPASIELRDALGRLKSSLYVRYDSPGRNPESNESVVSMSEDGQSSAMISISDDGIPGDVITNDEDDTFSQSQQQLHLDSDGNNMPNIVTTVIIKMLRKEIKHLKEISIADSQVISNLKARVYDDESTLASDTEYIRFMNKKLLSESNLAVLYNDPECPNRGMGKYRGTSAVSLLSEGRSPREEEESPIGAQSRRSSVAPHLDMVVEESFSGKSPATSLKASADAGTASAGDADAGAAVAAAAAETIIAAAATAAAAAGADADVGADGADADADADDIVDVNGLLSVVKNLRGEVTAYRGMLQDDSVIISALKSKLGLEDSDEIEIPGYIGVHSVRTSSPIQINTFTDEDGPDNASRASRGVGERNDANGGCTDPDAVDVDEMVDLKHKVHILRNMMIQQGSQVRELMRDLDASERVPRAPAVRVTGDSSQPEVDFELYLANITDVEEAKEQLTKLHFINQDQQSVIRGHEIQVDCLQLDLHGTERDREKSTAALKDCRDDLSAARASLLDASNKLEQQRYRAELKATSATSQLPISSREDDIRYKMSRKIQNRMRIFLARRRIKTIRNMLLARKANVLFALKGTTQGMHLVILYLMVYYK